MLVIYRPSCGNSKSGKDQIITYCEAIKDLWKCELLLLGDFNWDASKTSSPSKSYIRDIETVLVVEQLIMCPTRITIHTQSVIDLVLSNITNAAHYGCSSLIISDHFPIYIVKKQENLIIHSKKVFKHSFRDYRKEICQDNYRKCIGVLSIV